MTYLLGMTLLVIPWLILPFSEVHDQLSIQVFVMDILFMAIIVMGGEFKYRNAVFKMLCTWLFFNIGWYLLLPLFVYPTDRGQVFNQTMLLPSVHCLLGIGASFAILGRRIDYVRIARMLVWSSIAVATASILQAFGFDYLVIFNVRYIGDARVCAGLGNPNVVASYLVLCLPLVFEYVPWGLIAVLGGILVTKSHLGVVMGVLALLVCTYGKYAKLRIWVILTGVVCSCILIVNQQFVKLSTGFSGRLYLWEGALDIIKRNPIFGHGVGRWSSLNAIIRRDGYQNTIWFTMHNDWLERWFDVGFVGMVLVALVGIHSIRKCKGYSPYRISLIVAMIMCLGTFLMENPVTMLLVMTAWWACESA